MNPVSQYIQNFPDEVQERLEQLRSCIMRLAPDAVESMAYNMPAYKTYGRPLVYFAAFKNHIGLYALPSGHATFATSLAAYKQGKGSVQFPLDQSMPFDLIEKIILYRVEENNLFRQKNKKGS